MLIIPLPDYEARAVRIANKILARAVKFDMAGTAFTMRDLLEMQARLPYFAEEHGSVRTPLARSLPDFSLCARHTPWAPGVRRLPSRAASRSSAPPTSSSRTGKYSRFSPHHSVRSTLSHVLTFKGGGMVQHTPPDDDAAQEVVARFERCWSGARVVDEAMLADFRRNGRRSSPRGSYPGRWRRGRKTGAAIPDPAVAFGIARKHLKETAHLWDWADDVEFIGLSRVEFVSGAKRTQN